MLITFRCERAQPVMMFSEVAFELLERMGLPGSAKGRIAPGQIPSLLERLDRGFQEEAARAADEARRVAAEAGAPKPRPTGAGDGEEEEARPVALAVRAFPLKELLRHAHRRGYAVSWS